MKGRAAGMPQSGGPVWMLMHRSLVHRHHAFWRGRTRALCGQVVPPNLDQDPGFAQRAKDLAVKQLVAEAGIETHTVAVFPW